MWITFCGKRYTLASAEREEDEVVRSHLFEIDLGVCAHTGLADEVDDPLLALIA